ncbi:MAG: hypothetical protein IJL91_08750 [Bacteroidales bacterium]|nr:hypothetical protein [Bacteroidales bacterium]MBQ6577820.1 hypothetical protein [Bacteroidales bacterium]
MLQERKRGGPRKGAGRKAQPESEKRVAVTLSVSPESRKLMNALRRRKINISRVFDQCLKEYCEDHFIVPLKKDEIKPGKKLQNSAGKESEPE